jgi:hypothetical protein
MSDRPSRTSALGFRPVATQGQNPVTGTVITDRGFTPGKPQGGYQPATGQGAPANPPSGGSGGSGGKK